MGLDGEQMKSFYGDLFGWASEPVPGFDSYHIIDKDVAGGIGGAVGKGSADMPNYLTFYVQVDSVDAYLARAEAGGASIVTGRTVVPGVVTFGLFSDPAGNIVGVVEEETPPGE